MRRAIRSLARDSRAASAVEYGLIIAMICILGLGALSSINRSNGSVWGNLVAVIPTLS